MKHITISIIFLFSNMLIQTRIPASMNESIQAIVLAAGQGTRFKTGITKQIVPICGQAMILYPLVALTKLNIPTTVVVGFQADLVIKIIEQAQLSSFSFVEQKEQKGTGHALLCTQEIWHADHLLVMNGDMPLITDNIINNLWQLHRAQNSAISFVTTYNVDPQLSFGRIIQEGNHIKIVESKHFMGNIKDHPLVNAGIYLINRKFLEQYLNKLGQHEGSNEFYITDLVEIASNHHLSVSTLEVPFGPVHGINTLKELADVENIKQQEIIERLMNQGVRFYQPATTRVDIHATIAAGTTIESGVHVLGYTTIGKHCTIKAFSYLVDSHIDDNVTIQPHSMFENQYIKQDTLTTEPVAISTRLNQLHVS
jgi:bifunctional UDP-N-acetylglucosamine pyrophosphorylase / glucosamine-1-phosphate N-acetyltransferase